MMQKHKMKSAEREKEYMPPASVVKVLFVCTGNTCRSPMAEGIFRRLIENGAEQERIFCQSAGLSAVENMPVSENAVLACADVDMDISAHKARRIKPIDTQIWDLYFTMSSTHGYILEKAGVPGNKIYIPSYIPDPFGKDLDEYRKCREKLEKEVKIFYNTVVQRMLILKGGSVGSSYMD
ncbi:arsenate reductase/protein-tyrosine-phosphatase family protein [Scatolibacter rhodanostii]|uniref:arsenate reductase/protein-tyrosine-phosphatase family protein n=1 Tax=Scatolibacter rhodanostii TaxID=2014781 RepID=UPI000C08B3FA|nr:low molecular weight phosphatase family protein [Scatolibacter rhodanostii]